MSVQLVDYFKLFKVFDLKKLNKHGDVRLTQDKHLSRKVLSVDGNVSTHNYIAFSTASIPNIPFNQRYLYLFGFADAGRNFCFDVVVHFNSKVHKFAFSTVYKSIKITNNGIQLPIAEMKTNKWTVVVVDLYDLCEKHCGGGQIRLTFKLESVCIRANSKLKGIYQSDTLYDAETIPKEISFPRKNQNYYDLYNYFVLGDTTKIPTKDKIEEKPEKVEEKPQKVKDKPEKVEKIQIKQKLSPRKNIKKKAQKPKEQFTYIEEQEDHPRITCIPKPKPTLHTRILAIEGNTIAKGSIRCVQAFITAPMMFPVHKPIKCISGYGFRLAVGYVDGSVCIWHSVKRVPIQYFKTELTEIKVMNLLGETLYLVGLDRMKRQLLMIVNGKDVLFKQVSNYSIEGFMVLEEVIISYGYENVRLWKLNPQKSLITGSSLYLGKMNHKNTYTSACCVGQLCYVTDSNGYLTIVSTKEEKMLTMHKIDDKPIDHILAKDNTLLVANIHGTIKQYSMDLQLMMEMEIGSRIKQIQFMGEELSLTHSNRSTSLLSLETGEFTFTQRCHTGKIKDIAYTHNKIISVGDQTVRIWSLERNNQKLTLKQQYQFLIKTQIPLCVCVGGNNAYVGFDSGSINKIDLNSYKIVKEEKLPECLGISMSKNNKNLIINAGQQALIMNNKLQLLSEYEHNEDKVLLCGFNQTMKKFYICWQTSAVQVYSLSSQLINQICVPLVPTTIHHKDNQLYLSDCTQLQLYNDESGQMLTMFSINISHLCFPITFQSHNSKLEVGIVGSKHKDIIDMPENIDNIRVIDVDEKEKMLVCSGRMSNCLYVLGLQCRNIQLLQFKQPQAEETQPIETQPIDTQHIETQMTQQIQSNYHQQSMEIQQPKQLKKLYQKQEEMFEYCKHVLIPQQPQQQQQYYHHEEEQPQQHQNMRVKLYYGWETTYNSNQRQQLIWLPSIQSGLFLSQQTLILHRFTPPVKQKFVRLPLKPTLIKEDKGYIVVVVGNTIKLYNYQLVNTKCIGSVVGERIYDVGVSKCEGYIVVLSGTNSKAYIQVIDIHDEKVISSSYLHKLQSMALKVNPTSVGLEFVVSSRSMILFYRLTSILTLQYQPLDKFQEIAKTVGQLSYVGFHFEDVILVGLVDGSVVVVDARSATIMIIIKNVIKAPIADILIKDNMIVVIGEGTSIISMFEMEQPSLEEFIRVISSKPLTITADSQIYSNSLIQITGNRYGMLAISKFGVLWLIDLEDRQTIKIMSMHSHVRACIEKDGLLVTGGKDGTVFETSLTTLQQSASVFKPRRSVECLLIHNQLITVGFGNQLYFYTLQYNYIGTVEMDGYILSLATCGEDYVLVTQYKMYLLHHLQSHPKLKVQLKLIAEFQGLRRDSKVLTWNNTLILLKESEKVSVWIRKKSKKSDFMETIFYLMDNYPVPAISVQFLSEFEYMVGTDSKIEYRNFNDHCIVKEMQINVRNISMIHLHHNLTYVGDQSGTLWILNENGLTVDKVKVFQTAIEGILLMKDKTIVYGDKLGVLA